MNDIRLYKILWGTIPVATIVVCWELTARWQLVPAEVYFPPFSDVVRELFDLATSGVLARNFLPSLYRVLIGLAAGTSMGILVGTAMGWKKQVRNALGPIRSAKCRIY